MDEPQQPEEVRPEVAKPTASELYIKLMEDNNLVVKATAVPVDQTTNGQLIIGCQLVIEYKK